MSVTHINALKLFGFLSVYVAIFKVNCVYIRYFIEFVSDNLGNYEQKYASGRKIQCLQLNLSNPREARAFHEF